LKAIPKSTLPKAIATNDKGEAQYDRFQMHQFAVAYLSQMRPSLSGPELPVLPTPWVIHPKLKELYSEAQLCLYASQYLELSERAPDPHQADARGQEVVDYLRLLETGIAAAEKARLNGDRDGVLTQTRKNALLVLTKSAALTVLTACRTPAERAKASRRADQAGTPVPPEASVATATRLSVRGPELGGPRRPSQLPKSGQKGWPLRLAAHPCPEWWP
jgi:hypothetical protein